MNALILVDLQNDFLPGGALAVPNGDAVISVANELMPLFYMIIATQDWHPENHGSFAANHPGAQPGNMTELGGLPGAKLHCSVLAEQAIKVAIFNYAKEHNLKFDALKDFNPDAEFDEGHEGETCG